MEGPSRMNAQTHTEPEFHSCLSLCLAPYFALLLWRQSGITPFKSIYKKEAAGTSVFAWSNMERVLGRSGTKPGVKTQPRAGHKRADKDMCKPSTDSLPLVIFNFFFSFFCFFWHHFQLQNWRTWERFSVQLLCSKTPMAHPWTSCSTVI